MTTKSNQWGLFFLRGIFALILGVLAIIVPGITFASLILLLGVYMLISGIFYTVQAYSTWKKSGHWGWFAIY